MSGIEDFISMMQGLGAIDEDIAAAAAPVIEAAAKKNVAAGLDPQGKAWPAKRDGSRALKNAADAVSAAAVGSTVYLKLDGVETFHQRYKEGASHPRRQSIPELGDPIPKYIADAIDAVAPEIVAARLA